MRQYDRQRQRFQRALLAAEDLEGADSSVFSAVSRKGASTATAATASSAAAGNAAGLDGAAALDGLSSSSSAAELPAAVASVLASTDADDGCAARCCSEYCLRHRRSRHRPALH